MWVRYYKRFDVASRVSGCVAYPRHELGDWLLLCVYITTLWWNPGIGVSLSRRHAGYGFVCLSFIYKKAHVSITLDIISGSILAYSSLMQNPLHTGRLGILSCRIATHDSTRTLLPMPRYYVVMHDP